MTTAAPPPLVAVSPTTVISAPVPKSKMSKSLTFHDIMLGQVTTAYAGEGADDVNGDEVVDDSIVVECVEEGYINGRVPASIIMMPNGKKMTMMNNCVHHTNHHHHHHHSLPLIGNQNSVENASHRNIDTKNKYIDTTNAPKQCDSARNHCNYYPPGGGIQPTAMSSNCIEPPVKCSNHVKFAQSGSCSIASTTRPPCGENASEGWVTTAGKKSTVIATTANNKNKQKLKSAVRTAASVDEALTRSGGGDARASKNDAEVATTTAARIFSSMKKKPTLKTSVSEMCDIGAPSMSSSGMKRTTTLIIPKDEPSTASTTNDHNHSSISEDEFADDDESDDTLSAVAVTKGRVGSTRSSSSGVNRRGLPFNVPFSTWLQLFLQRRRSRNAHSSAGVASRYPPASLMRNSVSLSVVHESSALGSDGESLEVSPCTSDQMSTSSLYPNGNDERCYVPNVKMRQKPQNRQWSEQDIQKRLSLPADIKLPQTVIDKLNRTPTLNNPLTRKSRRASLSEIGFGKLETYKKFFNLGEGTYATVYFGKSLLTGKSVALKEIRLEHEEGAPCTAIREVSLLRNLRHANVVTLHDVIYTERVLTLVFEYVQYDLREYMEKVDEIYVNNVKLFLMQLLRGLAYCHKRRILHRDLKPQNLLINHCGELKLADFGLARAQSVPTKTYSNEVVTLWYRPPDVLLGSTDYSTHIDMWGVGCILYEMLMHKAMFPGCTTDDQLNLIFRRLGTPTRETCPALFELTQAYRLKGYARFSAKSLVHPPRINADRADLLQKLLRYDGTKRISAEEAMRHKILDFFPSTIFSLADTESVLSLPKIYYVREQSWKSGGYMRSMLDK